MLSLTSVTKDNEEVVKPVATTRVLLTTSNICFTAQLINGKWVLEIWPGPASHARQSVSAWAGAGWAGEDRVDVETSEDDCEHGRANLADGIADTTDTTTTNHSHLATDTR